MSELEELLERFRRGGELLAVVTTGVAGAETDYSPGPDKWSIRQIASHLADSELVGADRLRRVIAEDNPTLIAFDQDAWATRLDYSRRKLSQAVETFRRIRGENYELLKSQPEEAWSRSGTHNERGQLTLLQLLRGYAEHAESHAKGIQSLRQLYRQSKAQ